MPEYRLARHGEEFVVVVTDETGKRKRIRTGAASKGAAERFLERFRKEANAAKSETATVADAYAAYLEWLKQHGKPTAMTLPFHWKSLGPAFGHLIPGDISDEKISEYTAARRAAGRKDGTINTQLGKLARIIAFGADKGICKAARKIERPKQSPARQWYVPKEDAPRLIEACGAPHIRTFVVLAITTAARMGALLELTWDRVDFDRGLIILGDGQERGNKHRATVPMNDTSREELAYARRFGISEYVIEHGGAKVASVKKGVKAAGVRAGMPWLSAHVLRHTAAMWMVSEGVPIAKVARYLGDTIASVEARYGSFAPGYLQDASNALEISAPRRLKIVKGST
jgi:integrase